MKVRDDGGGGKGSDSGYIFKGESTGFPDGVDAGCV